MGGRPRWSEFRERARQAKLNARIEMYRAVELLEEALREARTVLSEADPEGDLPRLMNTMASYYRESGRLDDAITTAREGLARQRATSPRSVVLIGNDAMFLCQALCEKGLTAEALSLAEEALTLYEEGMGADHGETHYVRSVVDRLRANQRR